MIRNGASGTNYETKLGFTIVSVIICLYDWKKNNRKDYIWIFLIGATIWTFVELLAHSSGNRVMTPPFLFGAAIPRLFGALLQGTFEGAFMSVLGVMFGDRLIDVETRKKYLVIFVGILSLIFLSSILRWVPAKNIGGNVSSRRRMFGFGGTIFFLTIVAMNLIWLWKKANKIQRRRVIFMFTVMLLITTVWTIGEYLANTRWIEVGIAPDNLRQAPPIIEFAALNYNNVIEFASAYVIFIIIPYELGLIREKSDD